MKRLYIDVDGVFFPTIYNQRVIAPHAGEFLAFSLEHFDCYRCLPLHNIQGADPLETSRSALADLLRQLKPARYDRLRTEVLSGDFYWIEHSPLAAEISDLCRRGALDRWIDANPRVRQDALPLAQQRLARALDEVAAPTRRREHRHHTEFPQWIAAN